ncbi:Protein of unknown function DUF677 [Macleaya cordata]|uniref:Uncharacterized protein n=1 Tax=Macleaya cordata TaxID=56857 RepID=A0A200QU31_MACCD|nr:Protein of unknown function DUF677 [Macleaya cordata]
MKFNVFNVRRSGTNRVSTPKGPSQSTDVCEEYANAFRTESYTEFWTRVLDLTNPDVLPLMECSTAERLPSYRLFAEHLLDPDQPTITKILSSTQPQNCPENHSLLLDYFSQTADASQLCGLLLKDINRTRTLYRPLKTTFKSLETTSENHFSAIFNRLTEFSNCLNYFGSSASLPFQTVQAGCNGLLKRLELRRERIRAKLRLIKRFKRGLVVCVVALTATIVVIVASHSLVMLVAVPGFITTTYNKVVSTKRLLCMSAQLEAAAKGTYILNKDLETISRHVARLDDEIEHVREMVRFWLERQGDVESVNLDSIPFEIFIPTLCYCNVKIQGRMHSPISGINTTPLFWRFYENESSFMEQLDELEEHLYLCFMTINRARNLVMKEVLELTRV